MKNLIIATLCAAMLLSVSAVPAFAVNTDGYIYRPDIDDRHIMSCVSQNSFHNSSDVVSLDRFYSTNGKKTYLDTHILFLIVFSALL